MNTKSKQNQTLTNLCNQVKITIDNKSEIDINKISKSYQTDRLIDNKTIRSK